MKHALLALLVAGTTTAFAQKNAVEKYFSQYQNNEDYTTIQMSGKLFELTMHIEAENEEEREFLDAVSKIQGMAFAGTDSVGNSKAQYRQALNAPGREFEELMNVRDEDMDVTFFIRENDGVVRELLVIAGGDQEFGVGSIWGEIDLKQVRKVMESIDMAGMHKFDEEAAEARASVNYYPNPVKSGQDGTLQLPEDMTDVTLKLYDLKGKELINQRINGTQTEVPLSDLAAGTYVMNLYRGNTRFYIEKIVVVR